MNLMLEARTVLESARYCTLASTTSADTFYFEDDNLIGSVTEYPGVSQLLDAWERTQDAFLGQHARQLRAHPAKSWNVYTIHLTSESAAAEFASRLFAVEEDFRGTRKVARAGIRTKEDLRRALLPLLPIQNLVALTRADQTERLRARLVDCHSSLEHLLGDLPIPEMANRILEAQ